MSAAVASTQDAQDVELVIKMLVIGDSGASIERMSLLQPASLVLHLSPVPLLGLTEISLGVGKSCLLMRFADDSFTEAFVSTIGVDFRTRVVQTRKGEPVKLQIWDTAGQERFRTITAAYYRNASAVVLTYDCTSAASFDNVVAWIGGLSSALGDGHGSVTKGLVATKCDVPSGRRIITTQQGEALAAKHGMRHYETSAKTGWGVEAAFEEIASDAVEALRARGPTSSGRVHTSGGLPLRAKRTKRKSACC